MDKNILIRIQQWLWLLIFDDLFDLYKEIIWKMEPVKKDDIPFDVMIKKMQDVTKVINKNYNVYISQSLSRSWWEWALIASPGTLFTNTSIQMMRIKSIRHIGSTFQRLNKAIDSFVQKNQSFKIKHKAQGVAGLGGIVPIFYVAAQIVQGAFGLMAGFFLGAAAYLGYIIARQSWNRYQDRQAAIEAGENQLLLLNQQVDLAVLRAEQAQNRVELIQAMIVFLSALGAFCLWLQEFISPITEN